MHPQDSDPPASNQSGHMPATDDEIREKYLERAIRELNLLAHDIYACESCGRGNVMPVLGAGHPQADIFMIKHSARASEVEEGVAFYGKAGAALMKSLKRLSIDPLAVYGTLYCKCPVDSELAAPECTARVLDELAIVRPRIVVAMGEQAVMDLNELGVPMAHPIKLEYGTVQNWTPTCDALVTPDIDSSLEDDTAKRKFWAAFRELGKWYSSLPPY